MSARRIIVVVVLAVLVVGGIVLAFALKSDNAVNPTPVGDNNLTKGPNITSQLPSDLPTGTNITLQGTKGSVDVKNFYKSAVGYWSEMNAILLIKEPAYEIWYYRANSNFEIAMQKESTTQDQKNAEAALEQILGLDSKTLCNLSSYVTVLADEIQGTREAMPLSFCSASNMVK